MGCVTGGETVLGKQESFLVFRDDCRFHFLRLQGCLRQGRIIFGVGGFR